MTRDGRFVAAMAVVTRVLPFGLSRVLAPSDVGYLVISLGTFLLNLVFLALFHGVLRVGLSVAVTLAFGLAAVINYVLNRVFNFRSHGAAGRQFVVFAAVEASNYLIFVLGLTDLLAAMGVYYELARVISACCEGLYLYCGLRWLVFRDTLGVPRTAGAAAASRGGATDVLESETSEVGSGA